MPTLALLDGHSLAFRAFFALPADLATSSGQVTNAVYGFTSMLIKLLDEEKPEALAVAWDVAGETFRSTEYPDYKGTRDAAPDLFRSQLPLIHEVATVLRLPQFGVTGFEADDVIATLARRAVRDGWDVVVVTGDRDSFQLVDDHITVLYTRRGITDTVKADAAWIEGRYGVTPEQYVDYAALRGDSSDNLPGVPGVGEKTASRLIATYGSLEGIYEHLEDQTPRLRENLAAGREQVFLNRRLSRLVDEVDLDVAPESLRLREWDPAEVREVFDGLAFRSLWTRLQELGGGAAAAGGEVLDVEVTTELEPGSVERLAGQDRIVAEPVWDGDDLAGLVVLENDDGRFVPFDGLGGLAPALADPAVPKLLHDAKPLVRVLLEEGMDLRGLAFDTALASYVINPAQPSTDLADLAGRVLGLELGSVDREAPVRQGTLAFGEGPDLEAAGARALAVARLAGPLEEQLEARGAAELFREVELPLVRVLARMEQAGIGVDRPYLEELGESLRDRLADLERKIHRAAGEPFNINSSLQLREVLFERLQLPVLKKTPKGQPSTDATVLARLVEEHPVVELLLRYRELEKLRSTYVDGLVPLVGPDGRIHARFNQTAAATGRLSSEQPNLQNIPVRSEEGRTIRRAFVPRPGWVFVVADYSQIELRILAHLSEDPGLLDAFSSGADIHSATAARTFGVEPAAVTPEMRRRAKVINFGLLYGMEAYGLAQRLEIDREEAATQIEAYFSQFPRVREFMEGVVAQAHRDGFTTTVFGRRRYLPELSSNNFRIRQAGERMALNAPIQGSAADIIKKAMIELDGRLEGTPGSGRLLLQVHDELVVECPPDAVEPTAKLMTEVMEGVVALRVPLTVDIGHGANLAETKA